MSPDLPSPANKKGKDELSSLLNTLSQVSLSSLNNSELITHLKSCMYYMLSIDNTKYLRRIGELEGAVENLKSELTECKLAFADSVISSYKSPAALFCPYCSS